MKRVLPVLLAVVAVVLLALQLVPVERTNPPIEETIDAPPEVLTLLRRSCFDCHSNETRWPWYSHVAPVSFLVAGDVDEAREHMNFSTWNRYSADERADHFDEIAEEVSEGGMPLPIYLVGHPGARPSAAEKERIVTWAGAAEEAADAQAEAAGEERDDDERERDGGHDHDHDHRH